LKPNRRVVQAQSSPLRGGYLVQNPVWRAWLSANDLALRVATRWRSQVVRTATPDRVLVAVGGHLGDAVIATKAITHLARALPDAVIGVLSGSWNRQILEGHPNVRRFHAVDHWKLNRASPSLFGAWTRYRQTRRIALREIREAQYDAALDLYAWYPNSAEILAAAEIPRRIGFASGGYGAFYTQPLQWELGWRVTDDHRAVLGALLPELRWDDSATYTLPADAAAQARWHERGRGLGLHQASYVLLQPGSGAAHREWRPEAWVEVARHFTTREVPVLLAGAGVRERALADMIAKAVPSVINLSGQLDLAELRCAIADAALVLSVNTLAAHLAVATNTPCVVLNTGTDTPERWFPDQVQSLMQPVPCSPCFRSRGCAEMTCLRQLPVETVLAAAEKHLRIETT
jgi:heptosyltransferase-3